MEVVGGIYGEWREDSCQLAWKWGGKVREMEDVIWSRGRWRLDTRKITPPSLYPPLVLARSSKKKKLKKDKGNHPNKGMERDWGCHAEMYFQYLKDWMDLNRSMLLLTLQMWANNVHPQHYVLILRLTPCGQVRIRWARDDTTPCPMGVVKSKYMSGGRLYDGPSIRLFYFLEALSGGMMVPYTNKDYIDQQLGKVLCKHATQVDMTPGSTSNALLKHYISTNMATISTLLWNGLLQWEEVHICDLLSMGWTKKRLVVDSGSDTLELEVQDSVPNVLLEGALSKLPSTCRESIQARTFVHVAIKADWENPAPCHCSQAYVHCGEYVREDAFYDSVGYLEQISAEFQCDRAPHFLMVDIAHLMLKYPPSPLKRDQVLERVRSFHPVLYSALTKPT